MCFTIMSSLPTLRLRFKNKSTTSILPRVAFVSPLLDLFFLDYFFAFQVMLNRELMFHSVESKSFSVAALSDDFRYSHTHSGFRPSGCEVVPTGEHVLQLLPLRDAFFLSTQVI